MCSRDWIERCQMFEDWPAIMVELGAPKRKHWWTELWQRGVANLNGKAEMEQT